MPTVFVFGNPDIPEDSLPMQIIKKIKLPNINFQIIDVNADLPFADHLLIMDTVYGLEQPALLTEKDLDKIVSSPRTTAHDYDLGFQLKYLRKLGHLKSFTILGIPPTSPPNLTVVKQLLSGLV